ncbi:hypothetical protein L6452_00070 [Arctium lappa]|uniref:Uncharacterized protein n=1 Tax=Arctium lappa TaxID=4217 RepID=A0ACB9FCE9_ARCLA|nr:hypothetical protein L6452_00070 [Arctium lappa]
MNFIFFCNLCWRYPVLSAIRVIPMRLNRYWSCCEGNDCLYHIGLNTDMFLPRLSWSRIICPFSQLFSHFVAFVAYVP